MINLMIGTPMYGGSCTAHYCFSMLNLTRNAVDMNVNLNFQFTTSESLIPRARNHIMNTFLHSDCDHLLFVDADIQFEPEHVQRLLDHDVPVVCGAYPAKLIDWTHVAKAVRAGVPDHLLPQYASASIFNRCSPQASDVPQGLIEVINAGTGFMMIQKQVVLQMLNHVPTYVNNQFDSVKGISHEFFSISIMNNILLSEDYHFCDAYRKLGGRIFVDPTVSLKHVGSHVYAFSPGHWIG